MNEKTKTGLEILEAALLLGVLGDILLRQTPWGLNVFLWVGVLVAAMIVLVLRRKKELWSAQTMALHGALIFFAAMFVWRDSIELKIYDTLAILAILGILTLPALKIKTQVAGVFQYIIAGCWAGMHSAFAPFLLVFDDIEWKSLPQNGWTKNLSAVLRGLAIAAPILFIFGALFMAADAVFQGIIEQTFHINPDTLLIHTIVIGMISWITAGYLRGTLVEVFAKTPPAKPPVVQPQRLSINKIDDDDENKPNQNAQNTPSTNVQPRVVNNESSWDWRKFDNTVLPNSFTLGAIEISIVLGLINLLFLSFVIVQIPYLFGGMDLVQTTPDFKLAEYARRGFGELVIVAALVLPILLLSHWLLRKDKPINEKIYRVLAMIQLGLLFVIMISATQRLLLLTGNLGYGLTTVRFYPMAFMVLLALIFVWFGLTVLRGARQQFAWGALWLTLFTLGTLHVMNPDDFIVRTNIRLLQEGREFDGHYNSYLSDDSVPALIEGLPAMNFEDQCRVKSKLVERSIEMSEENDFRSWNWSRWVAQHKIAENAESFDTSDCAQNTNQIYYQGGF